MVQNTPGLVSDFILGELIITITDEILEGAWAVSDFILVPNEMKQVKFQCNKTGLPYVRYVTRFGSAETYSTKYKINGTASTTRTTSLVPQVSYHITTGTGLNSHLFYI